MFIEKDSANAIWRSVVGTLTGHGDSVNVHESRVGPSYEILNFSFTLTNPRDNFVHEPVRRLSPSYAAGEFVWYLSGKRSIEAIEHYAPSYSQFAEDNGEAWGAYGYRWELHNQIAGVVLELRRNPNSRRAVMTMYDPALDLAVDRKDIPCTLSIQFQLRDGKLYATTTMRSNDAWMGLPYDIFCFTSLQILIAQALGVELGTYHHQVGSLHLYEKHYRRAKRLDPTPTEPLCFQSDELVAFDMYSLVLMEIMVRKNPLDEAGYKLICESLGAGSYWTRLVLCCAMHRMKDLDGLALGILHAELGEFLYRRIENCVLR